MGNILKIKKFNNIKNIYIYKYNIYNIIYYYNDNKYLYKYKIYKDIYIYYNNIFLLNLLYNKKLSSTYYLNINFKRNRFFPFFKKISSTNTLMNCSLGMVSSFFSKKKSFLKSKVSYLMLTSFLRKLLIFAEPKVFDLQIRGLPLYIRDILKTFFAPGNKPYLHPLTRLHTVDEEHSNFHDGFKINYVFFLGNKSYSYMKKKKKGRLKRRISRKIVFSNNIID